MRDRKSKKFKELLLQYEAMTNREKATTRFFFVELMPHAKNFADWSVIFSYGDDSVRKDALLKMVENVIHGQSRSEIRLNILELFIVIDNADKDEVLKRYLARFHKEEDFLFVLDVADWDNYKFTRFVNKEAKKYGFDLDFFDGEDERIAKLDELLKQSSFNPPSW